MKKCNISFCVFENYQSLSFLEYGGVWGQLMKEIDTERKIKILKSSIPELQTANLEVINLKLIPYFSA